MIKNIILILFTVVIFSACSEKQPKTLLYSDLLRNGIKGNVASIREITYDCDSTGKTREPRECCTTISEYDEHGLLLKTTMLNKAMIVTGEEITTSLHNGLKKSEATFSNGKKVRQMNFSLNDSNQYTGFTILDSAGNITMYARDFIQNEFGLPVSYELYGADNSFLMKEDAKYEGRHLLTSAQTGKDGKILSKYQAIYNNRGEGIEEIYFEYVEGKETINKRKHTYGEYDKAGNWTLQTEWDDKGRATTVTKREITYRKNQ